MTHFNVLRDMADDQSRSESDRRIAGALASAINDWPTFNSTSLEEYIGELRREIGDRLTQANVRSKYRSYLLANEVWKSESIYGLLYAWGTAEQDVVLEELIERLGLKIWA